MRYLPRVSRKPPFHVVPLAGSGRAVKALRVLVADDDRDNANMLAVVLRDEGHEVVVALRGDETLEMCRLFRPDAVIADVNMPGMSGYAIARELRERHGNLSPLLIAMSGVWTNTTDRLLGQTVGFDHYLVKPFDLKLMCALLANSQGAASDDGASSA
jgi:two-component system, OmpR family, response regulator